MSLKSTFNKFANIGIKPAYKPWEASLTRKLNLVTLIGSINTLIALGSFLLLDYSDFYLECIFVLMAAPSVLIFNYWKNYIWAAYSFYAIGFVFFMMLNLKMGIQSFVILLFFPLIISIVQLLSRKETVKHMAIIMTLCLITISFILIGYRYNWLFIYPTETVITNLQTISLFFSFSVTLAFIFTLSSESIKQEKLIGNMLDEKEVLLAEVFHRVKNNMNIVTSLLNLKKDSSDSKEVKDALEECRNRVFSMALVHQNIYNAKNFTNLSIKEYLHDLIDELTISMGSAENIQVFIDCEDINLNVSNAIPCGLIINELVTNSFKYGLNNKNKLRIDIEVKQNNKMINLRVRDNGPGIDFNNPKKYNSLGLDLVKSLSEQIDGEYSFKNDNGLVFDLKFKIAS